MTRWEYKIINLRSENYRLDPAFTPELDVLGEVGWELVGLTSVNPQVHCNFNALIKFPFGKGLEQSYGILPIIKCLSVESGQSFCIFFTPACH